MDAIIRGIRESDSMHLWTGHFESAHPTNWSSGNPLYKDYMDLDGLYAFTESSLGIDTPQYKTELAHYNRGKLIFQLDQSYEQDIPHGPDNEDPAWIRRKNYQGLLSGCAGTSFSPGTKNNPCYTLKDWRPLMNTRGMQEMYYCFLAFESRSWYLLIPDLTHSIVVSGGGRFGDHDYFCAARTSDSSTIMIYLTRKSRIEVDLRGLSGENATAWWFDPATGKSSPAGRYRGHQVQAFTPPSDGDWLLVLDDASRRLPAP
jgi:hypothetical protein